MDKRHGVVAELDIASTGAGILDGLSFAVKDVFAVAGRVTGYGSPTWSASHSPETEHAEAITRLLQAGATLKYVTVSDELAFSLDGLNSHYPVPLNVNVPGCIPGGSSSGSGSVVAAGLVDFALGTDTAGSVRVPAAYQGIYGLRPTWGSISTTGVLPLGVSFDTVGIMARSPEVLAKVHSVLAHSADSRTNVDANLAVVRAPMVIVDAAMSLVSERLGLRLFDMCERLSHACTRLETHSFSFELAELVHHFGVMRGYEAWKSHGDWFCKFGDEVQPVISGRLAACKQIKEIEYKASMLYRQKVRDELKEFFSDGRLLFMPAIWNYPPALDATVEELDLNRKTNLLLTTLASFAGLPQISIPLALGEHQGFPSAFAGSIVGGDFNDQRICAAAVRFANAAW